jgi:hypothetical protein
VHVLWDVPHAELYVSHGALATPGNQGQATRDTAVPAKEDHPETIGVAPALTMLVFTHNVQE